MHTHTNPQASYAPHPAGPGYILHTTEPRPSCQHGQPRGTAGLAKGGVAAATQRKETIPRREQARPAAASAALPSLRNTAQRQRANLEEDGGVLGTIQG